MRILRRKHRNTKVWKADVLARIKKPGCPACRHYSEEVDREFFWFVNEQYYEPEVVDDLRSSNGFCPIHTRHLLKTGASSVITTVFRYLTEYVIDRLQEAQTFLNHGTARKNPRDRCRQAAEIIRPPGACRACGVQQWWESHIISMLLQTLPDDDVRAVYQSSSGLCLPHFRSAGLIAGWDSLTFLTAGMRRRLMGIGTLDGPAPVLLEQAAGLDRERALRRRDQELRGSDAPVRRKEQDIIRLSHDADLRAISWSPTFEQALAALAEPGCPVCNARERGLQDYFRWLAREMKTVASPSDHWDLSWKVCPVHFWGLYAAGYEQAATVIARHTLQEWLWKLDELAAGLARRPSDRLLDRLAAVPVAWGQQLNASDGGRWRGMGCLWRVAASELESPARRLGRLRAPKFREDTCQACWHVRETTRRTIDLILRVMEDPAGRQAYHQAWGLCLRHCIAAASVAEVPAALGEIIKAQIARLRLLEWELHEASRKLSWSVRYEPRGPEQSAWRRAAYQFCGV